VANFEKVGREEEHEPDGDGNASGPLPTAFGLEKVDCYSSFMDSREYRDCRVH
jgi:hypothetical protein